MSRKRLIIPILVPLLAIGAVEGVAWWWMNPPSTRADVPVLAYVPPPARSSSGDSAKTPSGSASVAMDAEVLSFLPLPEVYNQAARSMHCSGGSVYGVTTSNGLGAYLAYFEWNRSDVGRVFEAFRHLPEQCMGSIGMRLLSVEPARKYQVAGETLMFDHTIFLDGSGVSDPRNTVLGSPLVHAFKAVWVSGLSNVEVRDGLLGYQEQNLRQARLRAALTRFRPNHARVIQGAVRGAANADAAWKAFENLMLRDLRIDRVENR